ncbi:similar to Saccharomyces cerevisiae YGR193C PDX1 Dihydrolipoamide dehydrogenase (E3)-binding protein (E3BP) of the mitochondrial pyruvate dehydrogenase (PDH) complex [Maudiozyma saulgeensis]|uniref:Similar to Saccharomyces cerevisiae YGR193C PDX1 Dihydrolipoamide dehydrogenase (E3)-binding protein (E3BP) of the mitochondrial pyruvate dehydrogenase (PDH) complex n=1 Tax=Maudiozyma saulgeensis TaxID=1789683 RepID=A0A1X7R728_9SACH|nr:similar to Saccharomyces cerevisiae YGR193C PDX1 Dihydrolipoamide dehydrogenase (E3)-binding protein (E3BP) of the mitochondrial pyruvate dehydrogenase (PDH) complex [Kazachstania saulgeensis]
MLRANVSRLARNSNLWRCIPRKGFHWQGSQLAIQPYLMPAMSPTMEMGGIVHWKVKAGEEYAAGDVLLEIETDKAQIDVEALDDGKIVRILKQDGEKDIAVGTSIAITADVDDDVSAIDVDSLIAGTKEKKTIKKQEKPVVAKEPVVTEDKKATSTKGDTTMYVANKSQTLLPSVSMLLAENGISKEDALENIPATGLHGTLLKGDILSHLGKIPKESSVAIEEYINKSRHLDLTGIEKTILTSSQVNDTVASVVEDKPQVVKKPAYAPDIVMEEDLVMEVPLSVSYEHLYSSVKVFLQEAYQYAHLGGLVGNQSEHYDPIFEELVTAEPRASRFEYKFSLVPLDNNTLDIGSQTNDIFDILASTKNNKISSIQEENDPQSSNYMLSLDITVNNHFSDSEAKANTFLEYVRDLQDVQG